MTYKFTPGEYKTVKGRDAVVLCDDAPGEWPLKGYVTREGGSFEASWRADGISTREGFDLVAPVTEPEQVVRWLHIWEGGHVTTDGTPYGAGYRLFGDKLIARTRVVLAPGVFEDENTPDPYTRGWNEALEAADKELWKLNYSTASDERRNIVALKRSAP